MITESWPLPLSSSKQWCNNKLNKRHCCGQRAVIILGITVVNGINPNQALTVNEPATWNGVDLEIDALPRSSIQSQETFHDFWQNSSDQPPPHTSVIFLYTFSVAIWQGSGLP
jgi:hypothetical protein